MSKVSTINIIKSQATDTITNFALYLKIYVPYLIITSIYSLLFSLEHILFFGFYIILDFLIIMPVAICTHQFVILNKKISYFEVIKNIKQFENYFYFSLIIFITSVFPLVFSIGVTYGFLETSQYYSRELGIAYLILCLILFLFGIIMIFVVYPFLAFSLPKAAIGETINIIEIYKSSKGFRLTIFFQTLLIVTLSCIIYLGTLEGIELIFDNSTYEKFSIEYFILLILDSFFTMFGTILGISCLSKTYLLWKETKH